MHPATVTTQVLHIFQAIVVYTHLTRNSTRMSTRKGNKSDSISFILPHKLIIKALLLLPRIPPQLPTNTINPILTPPSMLHHIRKRIPTRTDRNIITWMQFHPLPSIKTRPRAGSSIVGYTDAENDSVGEDDGTEGECVRADGGDKYYRVLGMAEGAACCEIVCC